MEVASRQFRVLSNSRLFRINEPCPVNLDKASVIFETISLSCLASPVSIINSLDQTYYSGTSINGVSINGEPL